MHEGLFNLKTRYFKVVGFVLPIAFGLLLVFTACSSNDPEESISGDAGSVAATSGAAMIAEDEVVNRFINEFNATSQYEISDVEKGNIRTKYFGYANDRYLEMINANDAVAEAFCLTINGGQDETAKQAMFEVFRDAVKTMDPSITDEMVDAAVADFDSGVALPDDYSIGNNIFVDYTPITDLTEWVSPCRIDIICTDYK